MDSHIKKTADESVVAALVEAREKADHTQRSLASELPAWLGWTHITVAKIEKNRRGLTLPEIREYARACKTTVAAIDARAQEIQSALTHVPSRKRR